MTARGRRRVGVALALGLAVAGAVTAQQDAEPGGRLVDLPPEAVLEAARHMSTQLSLPSLADMDAAMNKGVGYLVKSQAEDGSWGGWQQPGPYDDWWSNKYTHLGWQIATTGLVAMALMEQPETPPIRGAIDRGLDYLVASEVPKRPSDWDTDNTWGMVYGLAGLATALEDPRYGGDPTWRPRLEAKAVQYIERLAAYQTPSGGWGYYDFETLALRPSWATSFMTAAAVVALEQTRRLELSIPEDVREGMPDGSLQGMLDRAVAGLARCRLPNGAYDYSLSPVPTPGRMEGINNVRGSLGRIQAGNFALVYAGFEDVERDDLLAGLDHFFEHHRFLDVARKRPVPHEAYYANAGYFYFFGHYYAGRVLELLDPAERVRYQTRLAWEVIKTQEQDGSMWDYYMNSYHRPYGTAFGLMTLRRCLPDELQLAPR